MRYVIYSTETLLNVNILANLKLLNVSILVKLELNKNAHVKLCTMANPRFHRRRTFCKAYADAAWII
jgi:hypothetical protein